MTIEQLFINLSSPKSCVDVILDTDAFNEIDDQFAIGYMMKKPERFNVKAICAAPFTNEKASTPAEGMEKSYDEILKLLSLMGMDDKKDMVYKGSESYLPDEQTPVESPAAAFMADLADSYSPENPLYIIAIGAITNVASAILKNPKMCDNCVLVWLGGHATHMPFAVGEFNMHQDIAGARIVFGCQIPLVQLPCNGVVDQFATTGPELRYWLSGKNALCDYLCENTVKEAESYAAGKPWSRPIWDVCAVAWIVNDGWQFMREKLIPAPIPEYDGYYAYDDHRHFIKYIYKINRDRLFEELFSVLAK
jgi:inosine-uridine nucleoside N-ribohydrolase